MLDDFEARIEARDLISKGFERLSPRDEDVLIGQVLYGEIARDIGARHGVTAARIHQIKEKALRRARTHLYQRYHEGHAEKVEPSWPIWWVDPCDAREQALVSLRAVFPAVTISFHQAPDGVGMVAGLNGKRRVFVLARDRPEYWQAAANLALIWLKAGQPGGNSVHIF